MGGEARGLGEARGVREARSVQPIRAELSRQIRLSGVRESFISFTILGRFLN